MNSNTRTYFNKIFTPSLPFTTPYKMQPKYSQPVIRSQRFRDEGKPANNKNIVDGNMIVLRKRIEHERMKEKLNKTWYGSDGYQEINGWKYKAAGYDETYKKRGLVEEYVELAALVGRSFGLAFLLGTTFVFLYSLLMHIQT
ncbi:OLC1v1032140C1 [Oldenlandia corymbosa var. corymbosa]|uniref:OLC1v1032140C1 n=1 Tax=Oldenlandia corymbosa var. corymbosa TaxID=529605 RepID=A0AAV1CKB8_OLDCO|nr:OLC1v1032140C1 [Oldenlandia corymbosa var. corymbosa]